MFKPIRRQFAARALAFALVPALGPLPLAAHAGDGLSALLGAPASPSFYNQRSSVQDAFRRSRNASGMARRSGLDSIGRGRQHVRHGRGRPGGGTEVALGVLQIASGLLGLKAAYEAEKQARRGEENGSNLGGVAAVEPGGTPSQFAGAGQGADASGASRAPASVAGGEEWLRDAEAQGALSDVEEHFALPREKFLGYLQKGIDPKAILTRAPENALTPEEVAEGAKDFDAEEKALLAKSGATEGEAAFGLGTTGTAGASPEEGKGERAAGSSEPSDRSGASAESVYAQAAAKQNGLRDKLRRELASRSERMLGNVAPELSPELREAMALQEQQRQAAQARPLAELSLFDVVHLKYREKHKLLSP